MSRLIKPLSLLLSFITLISVISACGKTSEQTETETETETVTETETETGEETEAEEIKMLLAISC